MPELQASILDSCCGNKNKPMTNLTDHQTQERCERIDLHCHSTASDGDLSPTELIHRARDKGVTALALTDHDTLSGLSEARIAAEHVGLHLIPGMEVSCLWRTVTLHVVALNFGFDNPVMQELENRQLSARRARAETIAALLITKKLPDLLADAVARAPSGIPGRPHFAQVMIERGIVKSMDEAFKRYLGAGKIGDVQSGWMPLSDVMPILNEAGASTVIAHPCKYKLSWMRLRELFGEFKALGGTALEVAVAGHTPNEVRTLALECNRFGLKASRASDFHSPKYAWAELGSAPRMPESVVPVWEGWLKTSVN